MHNDIIGANREISSEQSVNLRLSLVRDTAFYKILQCFRILSLMSSKVVSGTCQLLHAILFFFLNRPTHFTSCQCSVNRLKSECQSSMQASSAIHKSRFFRECYRSMDFCESPSGLASHHRKSLYNVHMRPVFPAFIIFMVANMINRFNANLFA